MLYGYFLGDRVAYPVVDYFVKNQWKRFGLQKAMMNANGFFFFKFADEAGMLNVLKEGPWIIRSQPMFLHIWSPTSKLEKKEVKKLQVWVKIHDVPIAAYTEDGLSMIATAIGEPKMLDTYTSSMCTDNWGRSSYARALVEISAENGFKEELVIAVPELEGEGFSKMILSVEYEWSPLRCAHCKVFGHSDDSCPRQPRRAPKGPITGQNKQEGSNTRKQVKQPVVDKEGFTDVERKKAARKSGFPVNKQKQKFEYRPIGSKPHGGATTSGPPSSVKTHNPFDVLSDRGKNVGKNGEDYNFRTLRPVTEEEVKKAMFSIGNDKAPGPDGFTAAFFKNAWPLIGNDIVNAIKDFFDTGNLLRELNHTLIVLIPKVPTPMVVTDFRPIACCNVLYKCISKIIADRIKGGLNEIVSINQSAFVPGKKISDNILLTQELMHNYHRNVGPPRCAFKVDIQKAYDTVDWRFLKSVLRGFGFNDNMVRWIMMCVSSTSFSVCVNGMVHGFFRGKRGLRQGDPISPYLFTLVMEVLTGILQHSVRIDSSFKYHNRCEKQQIINLCFADDLFLFARGEVNSANCIMTSLSKFSKMSGLVPNNQKSTVFFCNVKDHVKQEILDIMPFVEGTLPVKYLGVPLISSTLRYSDCRVLVEKLEKRIMHWKNKLLSFAGRLQLIISVLSSMHIYWSSVFLLPVRVVKELEARMRNFLWSQDVSFNRGKAKVSWKVVCTPKYEGGLGIRRIGDMNKALMASHIWSIVMKRDSLWVKWVHSYRLKGKNFWVCKATSNSTWSWRKIIQLRHVIRKYVWSDVGNGRDTSAWFDFWSDLGPLGDFLSPRTITDADFRLDDTVFNIFSNDTWNWPVAWRDLFPVLIQLDHFHLDPSKSDRLLWKDGNECQDFSSSAVWHSVRHRESEVDWSGIVWFAQCIPRHAFMMWLIMKRKLLTQDKILQWDFSRRKNMNMMCCLLCYENFDSHQHLFFECKFSDEVWNMIRGKVGMEAVCSRWADITEWLCARIRSKKVEIYVAKLLVAAAAYTIWQERNARLFRNQLRPPEMVKDAILKTVRYKLMGAKLKINARVRKLLGDWDVATETKDDGG
ncbi:uncharacterized protein LOC110914533 [Helianthus annuus]|uniref:uncharacterized protein LOC110914533 n=1 Tax=Helianthus annuus TaxID=4232 RepID=UPI000B908B45|nr:uncharacterized protein LOC110914533 [Helianthus annuus]